MPMDPSALGGGDVSTSEPSPEQAPVPEQENYSPLPGFLKGVPEQDRAIVEKYVKDWDGQVTKRFQSIHDEYKGKLKPWDELGVDPTGVQQALQVINTLNNDPGRAYQVLGQMLQTDHPEIWAEIQGMAEEMSDPNTPVGDDSGYEGWDDLPPQVQQMIEAQNQQIQELMERFETTEHNQEEERLMAEFDSMLKDMHTRHGDFDDDWVTLQISKGIEPEQAAKNYLEKFGSSSNGSSQPRRPVPPIIGGQGGVPSDQVDVAKLGRTDRKDLVANLLDAAKNQG